MLVILGPSVVSDIRYSHCPDILKQYFTVGAIFVAILARAELETGGTTPLAELPELGSENHMIIQLIWPIVTFMVVTSVCLILHDNC